MIKCNKCGNKENNTDVNGNEIEPKKFQMSKVKSPSKKFKMCRCHGCDNIIEVKKCTCNE